MPLETKAHSDINPFIQIKWYARKIRSVKIRLHETAGLRSDLLRRVGLEPFPIDFRRMPFVATIDLLGIRLSEERYFVRLKEARKFKGHLLVLRTMRVCTWLIPSTDSSLFSNSSSRPVWSSGNFT